MFDLNAHRVYRHLDRPARIGPWTLSEFVVLALTLAVVCALTFFSPLEWMYKLVVPFMVITPVYVLLRLAAMKKRTPWKMLCLLWRAVRTAHHYTSAKGQTVRLILTTEHIEQEEDEL